MIKAGDRDNHLELSPAASKTARSPTWCDTGPNASGGSWESCREITWPVGTKSCSQLAQRFPGRRILRDNPREVLYDRDLAAEPSRTLDCA